MCAVSRYIFNGLVFVLVTLRFLKTNECSQVNYNNVYSQAVTS